VCIVRCKADVSAGQEREKLQRQIAASLESNERSRQIIARLNEAIARAEKP